MGSTNNSRLQAVGEIDLDGVLTSAIRRAEERNEDADVLALAVVEEVCDYLGERDARRKISAYLRKVRAKKGPGSTVGAALNATPPAQAPSVAGVDDDRPLSRVAFDAAGADVRRAQAEARLGRALAEYEAAERDWEGHERPVPKPIGQRLSAAQDELRAARTALRDTMRALGGEAQ